MGRSAVMLGGKRVKLRFWDERELKSQMEKLRKDIFLNLVSLYAPPILWMTLIFYLSSQSSFPVEDENVGYWVDFAVKKIAHLVVYAILFWFIFRAARNHLSFKKALIFSFVLTVLYAISDEYHQTFVSDREGTARDVLIDSLAALLCGLYVFKNRKPRTVRQ